MEAAWLNEKFAPEILPHKAEVVECLLGQISYMEKNLENLDSGSTYKMLHQMELDRLRFVVTSYLRIRLEKIETFLYSVLNSEEQRIQRDIDCYLTDNEVEFAKSYQEGTLKPYRYRNMQFWSFCFSTALEQHFGNVLSFWPQAQAYRERGSAPHPGNWPNQQAKPNIHSFVFAKSKSDIYGVVIDNANRDEDLVDLKAGSQIIISYNSIKNLVKSGDVSLI